VGPKVTDGGFILADFIVGYGPRGEGFAPQVKQDFGELFSVED
jgi:hypothetical protein